MKNALSTLFHFAYHLLIATFAAFGICLVIGGGIAASIWLAFNHGFFGFFCGIFVTTLVAFSVYTFTDN